jgi:release factor glutamine methyltransferase
VPPLPTLGQLLAEARPRLAATPFGAPPREAFLLLGHVLGLSEAQILTREDRPISEEDAARFRALIERRLTGEPVAYLTGEREFYGRSFQVDRRVLIPRPETEHLIETALALDLPARPRILDVGVGSGCIAVTLALEIPGARVAATDLSPGALQVAADNARRLIPPGSPPVRLVRADLTGGIDLSRLDLVVSNPPYVDRSEAASMSPEVCNFEPALALFPPGPGDSILARLFSECSDLRSGVMLLVEIGYGQLDAARRHAEASSLEVTGVTPDYAGIPRILALRRRQAVRP